MLRTRHGFHAMKAGIAAGLVVGLCDGVRVALSSGLSVTGFVATVTLAVAVDGFLGGLLGMVFSAGHAVRGWGLRGASRGARTISFVLLGAVAGLASIAALYLTAARVNRFLAAGVVVDVLLLAWLGCWVFAPPLARVLSGRSRQQPRDGGAPPAAPTSLVGLWWLAPLVLTMCSVAALVIVWRTRAPLRGAALWERGAWLFVIGLLTPWLVAEASSFGQRVQVKAFVVRAVALLAVTAGAVALLVSRWENDFQYLPWVSLLAAAAVVLVALALHRWFLQSGRFSYVLMVAWTLCIPAALLASSSEVARKTLAARGGLVGPTLTAATRLLDADRDGYARLMGGGDCNDADAEISPAALDWPDDGVDQDCDGKDALWQSMAAPRFHKVPAQVPADANVVLVAIDTLRADHLGAYGYKRPTSPNLDQLGKEGVVFENGWAHAPSTRFSMPAIFTGRWPSAINWEDCNACRSWWPRIRADAPTLGTSLKAAGLLTGSLWAYGYFDADERRGFERGIDVYDTKRGLLHTNVSGPAESVGSSAEQITDDAVAFVDEHQQKRFYLTVHYYDPHMSYEKHAQAPQFGETVLDQYDGEVWFTDHHIGRLFAALKEKGLWEKTIVVVTGDHGEGLGERGIMAHGYDLYPPQTKVPFIVRVPGLPPHRETTPVSHVDLAPTILNLVGGAHQPSFLGRSFVDLLAGQPDPTVAFSPVFQEVSYEGDNKKRAIVTSTHQLIWNWTPHNTTECYDLADPSARDVWGTPAGAEVCPSLKAKLRQWMALLSLPQDAREKMSNDVFGPQNKAPAPQHIATGNIGSALSLRGYDLAQNTFAPGSEVSIAYHFRANEKVPDGWKLFFHLSGPAGSFQNLDHAPVGGAFPLERWRPGQTVRDRHQFTLNPNLPRGRHTIYVGLWRGSDRMPVTPPDRTDGSNRLKMAEFEVK